MRSFHELLRAPGLGRLIATQLLARSPAGMFSLGMLMHIEHSHGNYTAAGAVLAAFSIGMAIAGPIVSRQLSRFGTSPVLLACLALTTTCLVPIVVTRLPLWLTLVLAVVGGMTIPPIVPTVRTLYPKLVEQHQITALFSLDAAMQEIIWVLGPVAITTMVVTLGSSTAMLVVIALQLCGVVLFIIQPAVRELRIPKASARLGKVLANPSVLLMTGASMLLIGAWASMEAAVVAWFGEGSLLAGVAIAISAAGSFVGGLMVGHRPLGRWSLALRLLVVLTGLALAVLVSGFWGLALAMFVAGLGTAPALAAVSSAIAESVSFADTAEAYGWITTGQLIGAAAGSAAAGIAIDNVGGQGGMLVSMFIGAAAVLVAAVFRRSQPEMGIAKT